MSAAGGFATVLHRGEGDAGVILISMLEKGGAARLFERMPQADGETGWVCTGEQKQGDSGDYERYLARRTVRDPDLWIIELDIADGERFIL